ncbi:hypothetical protein VZO05_08240 [Aggregatilineales bacterium SYSU G02658]
MSIEGLRVLLEKKEVVPTYTAYDLIHRPNQVESDYLYHVRTYVPINRAGAGRDNEISVEEFERRLIKQVKDGRAPRGYITAGFGYGKTTTGLYLWESGQRANLVVIPPFTLTDLIDFLHAIYGWLRYKLPERAPSLVGELDALYRRFIDISLDQLATSYGLTDQQARSLLREGRLVLELRANDYMHFFEESTRLAIRAGYEGLVVLPDEIQQYIRPKSKESGDPVTPFFSIIQALTTRSNSSELRFGFVMVITREELSYIRDAQRRGDLLHRMKDLQIDLTSLYNENFASNLWKLMAKQFNFEAEKDRVVEQETLQALGEITARSDLSDGPRTIVNVFTRIARRYVENPELPPYTPLDLMTDFLDEQVISFAGDDKLRKVLRRALESPHVREDPTRYAPAVKLAAAFPTKGVPLSVQKKYQLDRPLGELMRRAIGDLVQAGLIEQEAIRLSGLAQVREQTGWLSSIIREFRLGFNEHTKIAQQRFEEAFIQVLREKFFPSGRWRVELERERNYISNRSLVLRGTFDSIRSKYPSRSVQLRILWNDEPVKDNTLLGDICIEYQLILPSPEHQQEPGFLVESGANTARFGLNLYYHRLDYIPQNLQQHLQDVWSPYELSPIVLGNINTLIEEKRNEGVIPKSDDVLIRSGFQPTLRDAIYRLLFNPDIHDFRPTDELVGILLEARYPEYDPLITVEKWQNSLVKYINALKHLDSPMQRIGEMDVEGNKDEIAKLFTLANTGLDSFMRSFDKKLIEQTKEYPRGGGVGSVRFVLHPMEKQLMEWLRHSEHSSQIQIRNRTHTVHRLNLAEAWRDTAHLGYLKEEFEMLLELVQARGLAEVKGDWLVECVSETVDLDELRQQFRQLDDELTILLTTSDSQLLQKHKSDFEEKLRPALKKLNESTVDDNLATRFVTALKRMRSDISAWVEDERKRLKDILQNLQVSLIPQDYIDELRKPLNFNVEYVDQVNVVRVAFLKEIEQCQTRLLAYQQEINECLQTDLTDYKALALQSRKMNDLKRSQDELKRERQSVETMYQNYKRWQSLVNDGQRFYEQIGDKSGDEYEALRAQFKEFSTQIRGEISSQRRKIDALNLFASYEERLREFLKQAENLRSRRQSKFNDYQYKIKEILISYRLLTDSWRDVRFNENDETSYEEFNRNVRRIISEQNALYIQRVRESRQRLNTLPNRIDDLTNEQRLMVQKDVSDMLSQSESFVTNLENAYERIWQALSSYNASQGKDSIEQIRESLEQWHSVREVARQWLNGIKTVDLRLRKVELTPSEKNLLSSIRSASNADIVALRSRFNDEDSFWQALKGLYEKARITLQVKLIDEHESSESIQGNIG